MLSIGKLGKGQERYYLGKVPHAARTTTPAKARGRGKWIGGESSAPRSVHST